MIPQMKDANSALKDKGTYSFYVKFTQVKH